jgi:EAL and modified HD-GYP domain-containing signal transduction protein
MDHIFIGRQPIVDGAGKLYGYELLHRRAGRQRAIVRDGDRISSDMLLNAVLEIGIQQIAGTHRAFINVTQNLLMNAGLDALPSQGVVLEILEDVPVDSALLERLARLRGLQFEIALDDFVCLPERTALIEHADIVKLDVLAQDFDTLAREVAFLKRRGVRLLAEKVETPAMYQQLQPLGFDLYQGYFFARPDIYRSQRILPNKLVLLELLARVNQPDITPDELSDIIRGDVSMSVTVLRWANSPVLGLKFAVESIQRAIIVLGLQTIRNWVALLALTRMGASPSELLKMLLVRARCCELLAMSANLPNASSYFTVGLLSALDVILKLDMAEALERMPLGELARALFHELSFDHIGDCYLVAIAWADNLATTGLLPR